MTTSFAAPPSDGFRARWQRWDHDGDESLQLVWENEGWTAIGEVGRERVSYVIRLTATWQVSQFLLFRDLDEPDLWLGTDGGGRWGEVNGAHRPDLDGCTDLLLECTPFTVAIPIRRLQLDEGDAAELTVARIDVETLGVVPHHIRLENSGGARWRLEHLDARPDSAPVSDIDHAPSVEMFGVDAYGLPNDVDGRFRRR